MDNKNNLKKEDIEKLIVGIGAISESVAISYNALIDHGIDKETAAELAVCIIKNIMNMT